MEFSVVQYRDPESSRRARNISADNWEQFRDPVARLHNNGRTKQEILDWFTCNEHAQRVPT